MEYYDVPSEMNSFIVDVVQILAKALRADFSPNRVDWLCANAFTWSVFDLVVWLSDSPGILMCTNRMQICFLCKRV